MPSMARRPLNHNVAFLQDLRLTGIQLQLHLPVNNHTAIDGNGSVERGRRAGFEVKEADYGSAWDGNSRWRGEEVLVGGEVCVVAEVVGESLRGVGGFEGDETAWVLDLRDGVGRDGCFEDGFTGFGVVGGDVTMAGLFGGGHR